MVRMRTRLTALALLLIGSAPLHAQAGARPDAGADAQRTAMQKLAFLQGTWTGPLTLRRGPGEPMRLTQTEHVSSKLDGLLLLIEGSSRDAAGKVLFQALATVSFDPASGTYRFRAYNDGRYLDTELTVPTNGFSWSYAAGPAQITNSMHLSDAGEWSETTDAAINGAPPRRSMDMTLKKQP